MIYNWNRILISLIEKYGNTYSYYPEEYNSTKELINIKCNKCSSIFQTSLQKHRKGKECPNCIITDSKSRKKLSLGEVEIKLNKATPYYKFDIATYTKMGEPMKFICPIHGEFWQRPNLRLTQNQGCPSCAKEKRGQEKLLSLDEVKRVLDSQPIFYEYDIESFNGVLCKMKFICPIHGNFEQTYLNRSLNKRCLKCSKIEVPKKKRISKNEVYNRLKQQHNYEPNMETYISINNKMEFSCKIHGTFWQIPNLQFTQNQGCPKCNINKRELEINNIFGNIFRLHDRKLIEPLEIDFINYEKKFGVEYNGLAFHSFGIHKHSKFNNYHLLDKNKHLNKTKLMEEKGFQLFHIQSIHWNNPIKKEIWKSIINNKLGNSIKLFARKLKIIDLTNYKSFVKDFLNNNHLQGSCGYKFAYGLYNDRNEVYSIMTFGKSRFNKNAEYELLRFCNAKNFQVVGGASKLLKHFERIHKPKSLISYANRDWSQGNLYKQIGFKFIGITPPNYFYIDMNENIISRISAQKHKLKNFLGEDSFDEKLSERDNMINNGYRIYYDTGNLSFQKVIDN